MCAHIKWSMQLSCNGIYNSLKQGKIRNNNNNNTYFLLCSQRAPSDGPLLHSAPSSSNCTAIPGNSWEQNGALSARCKQCHSVPTAYKILLLAGPKEKDGKGC